MTEPRDPDRLLRAWLDLMPDEAPDRAIASVLLATAAVPQARELPRIGPWRSLPMNRISVAAAAIAIVALAGGGLILNRLMMPPTGGPSPVTGTSGPSADPTPAGSLSPTPSISFLPSVAQNGPIVLIIDGAAVAIAPDGSRFTLPLEDLFVWSCPTFSPDGRSLAYLANPAGFENRLHQELRVADAEGSNQRVLWTGLRVGPHTMGEVIWSPDRQRVAASAMFPLSGSGDGPGVAVGRLDGGQALYRAWGGGNLSWSPDGTRLVGTRLEQDGTGVIELHDLDEGSTWTLVGAPDVGSVAWSPDGQTITYAASSVPGGRFSLHVIRADGTDDRVVFTAPPGLGSPALLNMRWSPAGDLLALVVYDDDEAGPSFTIELFDRAWAHVGRVAPVSGTGTLFTWSPDGRSLLMFKGSDVTGPSTASIVPLDGGEITAVEIPADHFTACPIAWGAAVP